MNFKLNNVCQIDNEFYENLLNNTFDNNGFFIDVGSNDGKDCSNVKVLVDAGWSGLMLEPDKKPFQKCYNLYKNNNKIEVLNVGVSDKEEILTLNCSNLLSTFHNNGIYYNRLKSSKKQKIKCYTLDQILKQNKIEKIDLLSIDTEGWEDKVLKGFDIKKYLPKIIIIELHAGFRPNTRQKSEFETPEIVQYCRQKLLKSYKLIYSDHINDIYQCTNT